MRYEILGETLPVVICYLESGEKMVTEGGGMSWMSPNMKMETTSNGGIGKIFGRAFSGEKMFQNVYTAQGGEGMIAFASCFPGSIKAFEIAPGQEMILQKSAYLAGESGVDSLIKRSGLDYLVEKVLLCRKHLAMVSCLQNLMVMLWNMN